MSKSEIQISFFILFLIALSISPSTVLAESPKCVSAILVMDNSRSMKRNDPQGLRFAGLRFFLSLLDTGDQVGVISFSTVSVPLTNGFVTIKNSQDKKDLLSLLEDPPAEGYTDLRSALRLVSEMQKSARMNECRLALILLTDGKPEIAEPDPHYEQDILELASALDLPILVIALTPYAQTPFLEKLIDETGGLVVVAQDATDLLDAYLDIFKQIKDRTILHEKPSGPTSGLSVQIAPDLTPYIEKVSFVVSKPGHVSAELFGPDNNRPDFLFTIEDTHFAVFTVPHPVGGMWKIDLSSLSVVQAYTIIHSRLRVKVISPQEFHQTNQPMHVVVQLLEEMDNGQLRKIVGVSSFSALIIRPDGSQESLDYFYDDGSRGDELAGDGNFTRLYMNTAQAGVYKIEVSGHKGSVEAQGNMQTTVENFPQLIIEKAHLAFEVVDQPLSLYVHFDGSDLTKLDVRNIDAVIQYPNGEESRVAMTPNSKGFVGSFMPEEMGVYQVLFQATDAKYRNVAYQPELQTDFTVKIIRTVSVFPEEVSVSLSCLRNDYFIPLDLTLVSAHPEIFIFSISDTLGKITSSDQLTLSPGEGSVLINVLTDPALFSSQSYTGRLTIKSESSLEFIPTSSVRVHLEVPPIWMRCRKQVSWAGWTSMGLLFTAVVIVRQVRSRKIPPLVSGTLRYWSEGESTSGGREWDLTAYGKENLLIGSGDDVDLYLENADLATRHACLNAKDIDGNLVVVLEPLANVRKGYHNINAPLPLTHGDCIQMGKYIFQFLSDTGE